MIFIDKTTTDLLSHTITGDYDSYYGWDQVLSPSKSVDSCIISDLKHGDDGLVWVDKKKFAEDVLACCNRRGEYVVDTYVNGQVEVDDGKDDATCMHRVHLEDNRMLAYTDYVTLYDITPNSCNADITYKVTVVFARDQVDYAKDDDGVVVPDGLDWDNPYMIVIEEL